MHKGKSDGTSRGERERVAFFAFAAVCVVVGAVAFYFPAYRRAGMWPAPLDDVYIYFDFARSIAKAHPLEWIPGNGYSSGATSLLYPFLLAPGWLLGLRGAWLGLWAALIAAVCLVDLCRSLRELAKPCPAWVTYLFPPLVLCAPLLDWSWFSGMEVALVGALIGRSLLAVRRAQEAQPHARAKAQLHAGAMLALLVMARPEAIALAAPLALCVAYASGSLGAIPSIARAAGPMAAWLLLQAAMNRAFTGEVAAAGAVRKLLTSDPYTTRLDVAIGVLKNLIALRTTAFDAALGGSPLSFVVLLLGAIALFDKRTRSLAIALFIGAFGMLGLVSLNSTALFQNWRYAAPSIALLLVGAALGGAVLARWARRRPWVGLFAAALLVTAIVAPASAFERQIDHFAKASANIAGQQVEAGKRLAARTPKPRRVFLSDAGAIPYFSGIPAIDGLGLGGYRGMPFARASVHGIPAVVELIERIDPASRPDVLAVYPSWWQGLADVFGERFDAVAIEDNVICAAPEKVLYDADFSALADPEDRRRGAVFELDVADIMSERDHLYEAPIPRGGWVIGAVLELVDNSYSNPQSRVRRFDAGRIVPQGRQERFRVSPGLAEAPGVLILRTDGGPAQVVNVHVERDSGTALDIEVPIGERPQDRWTEIRIPLPTVRGYDTITIRSVSGAFRDFHVWIVRDEATR